MSKVRSSGWVVFFIGLFMVAMGIHMLGHDEPGWWVPLDIFMTGLGVFDMAIGYALITTGEK